MLTVIEGIPAPLLVPMPMLSTGPALGIPTIGTTPVVETEVIGEAIVTDGTAQVDPGLTFTQIVVNGNIYVWADSPETVSLPNNTAINEDGYTTTATNGTFWYDYETGIITIPSAIPNGVTIVAYKSITPYKTDKISTIPIALKDAFSAISIQYTLFSPPSVSSVTFLCRRNEISGVLSKFSATSPVNIDGHKYYPTQKSVVDSPVENKAAIAIGFESQFRSNPPRTNLDRSVRIKPLLTKTNNKKISKYTTAQVAAKAGVPYSGASFEIKVARNIDSNASTTLRQLLSPDRLAVKGRFLRLDRNTVEIASWKGVKTHTIQLSELKDGDRAIPPINYNGSGRSIQGVPLLVELRNAELQLDKDLEDDELGDKEETRVSGDPSPTTPPTEGYYSFDANKLRSMSMVFDNGGPTKKKIITKLLNGQPTEETEEYYGFIYNSKDVYDYYVRTIAGKQRADIYFTGGNPNSLWRKFKTITKQFVYNSEGYLVNVITTVNLVQRILKESDQLEAISGVAGYAIQDPLSSSAKKAYEAQNFLFNGSGLYDFTGGGGGAGSSISVGYSPPGAISDSDVIADLTTSLSFTPKQVYITTETRNLTALKSYYDDIDSPDDEDDPDWVEPRFVETRTIAESGVQIISDPRRTQKKKNPPIIFGKESIQIEKIEILSAKDPENFKTIQTVTNKEGEQLQDTATDTQFATQAGRPSQAERLVIFGKSAKEPKDEDEDEPKYLASTPGLSGDGISQTISFPGAYKLGQATTALGLWLLTQNLDAATTSLSLTHERKQFRVGDKVNYNGKRWRIKSIRNIKERDRQLEFTVELGFDFGKIPFSISTIKPGSNTSTISLPQPQQQ